MSSPADPASAEVRTYINSVSSLCDHVLDLRANADETSRVVVAIAGAPGSGKSTLAESLPEILDVELTKNGEASVVVPMDGFHLDNAILDQRHLRAVKGSPQTFDVAGFASLLGRIANRADQSVYIPAFDRAADLARNACQEVLNSHSVVIVEGNYLLLRQTGWNELSPYFDCTIMLDVPFDILEARLIQRWLDHGHTEEQARQRALSNDIPNARTVVEESIPAHLYYESVRQ